ncbi:type I-E CRISPR-associated protein Cas7/Cse4/CasC [Crossiella sp. CA-258035]|uniref:type I-E CRISPR-associated protein Cas7/Cse4/CasC n=1 Tax=Crossiella sp. CA-258035 TaxID=2981138 RepID=UPI0024BD1B4E|nr:type I-E CRISPR-associated protein Cas7/Cse4/CasC [Crossiella sp. CA-258035]WHT23392.1 type I-E CRISPR-associated protein Cas7/Cse4/CasC [Crossiella sp. CA-258035]
MPRTILDVHIIQSVPPSNINRDDTGSPKTAVYGGRRRARVSSQAWKRATREAFPAHLDRSELGMRTRQVVEVLATEITRQAPALAERAADLAGEVLTAIGIKTKAARKDGAAPESEFLLFLSHRQIESLAELAVTAATEAGDGKVSINKQEAKARADREHSVDIALFGRMVASATDLNVEAAVQVAHALSVHAVDNEYDYFTAVDDSKKNNDDEDAGAGMIGTVEFNSSTLYRYAALDLDALCDNLGDATAAVRAAEAFTRAFITSMPSGKQNTFANRTLPDAVLLIVRQRQPINLVGAFEEVVEDNAEHGRVHAAIGKLAEHARELHTAFDETPVAAWTFGIGEKKIAPLAELATHTTFDPAVRAVGELLGQRLAASS